MRTKPITVQGVKDAIKKQFAIENSEHGINRFETNKAINRLTQIIDQFHDAELPSEEGIIAKVESFAKAQSKTVPDRHGDLKKGYYWGMSDAINYIKSKNK